MVVGGPYVWYMVSGTCMGTAWEDLSVLEELFKAGAIEDSRAGTQGDAREAGGKSGERALEDRHWPMRAVAVVRRGEGQEFAKLGNGR